MKNIRKKILPFAFLASASILAACAGGDNGSKKESGDSASTTKEIDVSVDPNVEDTLRILVPSGNQEETTMIEKAAEAFSINYPNVTIKTEFVTVSNYETMVRQQMMAGSLPDIVWTNSPEYLFLIKNGIAENLDPYMDASTKAGEFNISDYKTDFFKMGSLNGTHYVIPRSADTVVCFYNEKLLKDANIDTSSIKNGWTWDEFKNICAKWRAYQDSNGNTAAGGYYCCDPYLTGWNSVTYPMLRSFGGEVVGEDGACAIDCDGTRAMINELRDITDKGYIVRIGVDSGSSFETGSVPFCFQSAAFSHYDDRAVLKGNINVVSMPLIQANNAPKIGAGIAGYSINAKISTQQKKNLAWQFLRFILTKEGQEAMAEGGLNVPPIRHDMDDFTKEKWGEGYEDRNLSAYTWGDEYKITDEFLSHADVSKMNRLNLAFTDFVTNASNNRKTVDEVISTAVSAIGKALK